MENTQKTEKASLLTAKNCATVALAAGIALAPSLGFAADAFTSTSGGACTFMKNIHTILNLISIAVVTIAVIFAGYQIAFAHKRIAEVAPIFIGGLLIGAAGQIAVMLIGGSDQCSASLQIMQAFV